MDELQLLAVKPGSGNMLKKITGSLLAVGFASLSWAQWLDLNQATEMELDGLKGVGPVLSREVINERQKAPFKDWNDATRRVKGLGPQKAESLSEQGVRVQGTAYTGKAEDPKSSKGGAKDRPPSTASPSGEVSPAKAASARH